MRLLGVFIHVAKDGGYIFKSKIKKPEKVVGEKVYDKDMRVVGRVVDLMGSTKAPYLKVKMKRSISEVYVRGWRNNG